MAWLHAVIDVPAELHAPSADFWGRALGWSSGDPWRNHPELSSFEPTDGDAYVHLQVIDGPPRVHLDIEADDPSAVVSHASGAGAVLVGAFERWTTMLSPGGLPFCVLRAIRTSHRSPCDGRMVNGPGWSRSASTRRLTDTMPRSPSGGPCSATAGRTPRPGSSRENGTTTRVHPSSSCSNGWMNRQDPSGRTLTSGPTEPLPRHVGSSQRARTMLERCPAVGMSFGTLRGCRCASRAMLPNKRNIGNWPRRPLRCPRSSSRLGRPPSTAKPCSTRLLAADATIHMACARSSLTAFQGPGQLPVCRCLQRALK